MNSHSPFKYLYSYSNTKEDYKLFFGRNKEIESVKRQLSKTKFLIVYGPSGSGKTSLLNAGILYPQRTKEEATLELRFNSTGNDGVKDVFVRVSQEWNPGIGKYLEDLFHCKKSIIELELKRKEIKDLYLLDRNSKAFDTDTFGKINSEIDSLTLKFSQLVKVLHTEFINLYQELNQVPILIFDQFEEIFIFHNNSDRYIDDIGILLDILLSNSLPIKIFLFIRSDYFGHLVHLERHFPKVFYPKVLVDTPDRKTLEIIVNNLFNEFKVSTKNEDRSEVAKILDNILVKKSDDFFEHSDLYFLPYLQIYLDALYQKAFKDTYKGEKFDNNQLKELIISNKDVEKLGSINKVLMKLIRRINKDILEDSKSFKNVDVRNRIQEVKLPATILLKKLVSSRKTKKRFYFSEDGFSRKDVNYLLGGFLFENVSPEDQQSVLKIMLEELEKNRLIILNEKEQYLELIHDSLAEFISTIVVDKDEQVLLAQKFVADYELHKSYEKDDVDFFLGNEIQEKIGHKYNLRKYLSALDVEMIDEYSKFWYESRKYNKAEEIRAKRRKNMFIAFITICLLVTTGFLLNSKVANWNKDSAKAGLKIEQEKSLKEGEILQSVGMAFGAGKSDIKSAFDKLRIDTTTLLEIARHKKMDTLKFMDILKSPKILWEQSDEKEDTVELLRVVKKELETSYKYEIRRQYFQDIEGNLDKRPFYAKSVSLPNNAYIETSKSRNLNRSDDTIVIYALSHDFLQQFKVNFKNNTVLESDSISGKISTFEPFYLENKSKVLVSCNQEILVLDENLKIDKRKKVEHDFIIMEKLGNNTFLCLKDDNNTLFIYDLPRNKLRPFDYKINQFKNREINYISYLPETKEIIFGIKNSIDKGGIYKIDSNGILGGIIFNDIVAIKCIKVQKNGNIFFADASSVYKINASDIKESIIHKENIQPLIVHGNDENWEIRTIDTDENKFIIGTQGNVAQTYFNSGKTYKTAIRKQKLIGHSDDILNVSYVRNGDYVLTSSHGGTIKIWDVRDKFVSRSKIQSKNNGISELRFKDSSLFVAFRFIDSITYYGPGYIAEMNSKLENIEKYYYRGNKRRKNIEMRCFDFDDESIVAGTYWGKQVRNAQVQGSQVKSITPKVSFTVRDVRIMDSLMVIGTDHGIEIFIHRNNKYYKQKLPDISNIITQINAVDISLESNRIIGAGENGNLYMWHLNNYELVNNIQAHHDRVTDVCFSPDNNFFVSCSWDNKAKVWSMIDGTHIHEEFIINVHSNDIEDIDISPNNIIATASSDKTVQLHKVYYKGDKLIVKRKPSLINNNDVSIRAVTFGEADNIIYTGDKNGVIKKWDTNTFMNY